MAMDGFEYNPQVNFETMQKHIKSKVRLVGELMTVDNNVAVVKSSDGTPVNIELQTRAPPLSHAYGNVRLLHTHSAIPARRCGWSQFQPFRSAQLY